ncbi:hypothetical protein CEXT_364771 [Caerostris extrusa]|uniref:Uncharacterized protein n=1 Tax=Caerostris extrusa TaxID=172846 RepID=A0AAV4X9Q2_CAEEX|nr:hypothetical protein CEXT_364771 [Caerostris extrusa]
MRHFDLCPDAGPETHLGPSLRLIGCRIEKDCVSSDKWNPFPVADRGKRKPRVVCDGRMERVLLSEFCYPYHLFEHNKFFELSPMTPFAKFVACVACHLSIIKFSKCVVNLKKKKQNDHVVKEKKRKKKCEVDFRAP